jgi:hypothetical protein
MQLFEDFQREYMGYREPNEQIYSFLNRSGLPKYEQTRQVLNSWFCDIPEIYQKALKTSFCSGDKQHLGAFFEIYCHALLKKQGVGVDLQQVVDQTHGNPIDFLVKSSAAPLFYLEATVAADSDTATSSQKILGQLCETLNALKEPNFQLRLKVECESTRSLPTARIRTDIHNWLKKLDPNEIARKERTLSDRDKSYCYYEHDGWKIIFIAVSKPIDTKEKRRNTVLSLSPLKARWHENQNSLRNALESKAKKYGNFSLPYVIAIDILALDSLLCDIDDVLLGQEIALYNKQTGGELTLTRSPFLCDRPFSENGFWLARKGARNKHVSAVLLVNELMPWSIVQHPPIPELWHNPWAEKPLDLNIWQGPQMVFDEDSSQWLRHEGNSDCQLP